MAPHTFLGWKVLALGYLGTASYFHPMWAAEQGQTPRPSCLRGWDRPREPVP